MRMIVSNSAVKGMFEIPSKSAVTLAEFYGDGYIDNFNLTYFSDGSSLFFIIDDVTYQIKDTNSGSTNYPFVYNSKGIVTTSGLGASLGGFGSVILTRLPTTSTPALKRQLTVTPVTSNDSSVVEKTRMLNLYGTDIKANNYVLLLPPVSSSLNYTFEHPLIFKKNFKCIYYNAASSSYLTSFYISAIVND